MQHWLFNGGNSEASTIGESSSGSANDRKPVGNDGRLHTFRVLVNQRLEPGERVAVTGECSSLGRWLPAHCVQLNRECDSNIWSRDVYVPVNQVIPYRYLICSVDPMTENVHVRRWETHLNPRQIPADHPEEVTQIETETAPIVETTSKPMGSPSTSSKTPDIDTFGDINGLEKIDRGWLTTETVYQFKFIRNPFVLKQKLKHRLLYVKLTPMNLRINATESSAAHGFDVEDSMSNDTRENGSTEQPVYAFAEVATLKSKTNVFEPQAQFGRPYHQDDIMIFNVSVGDPENVAYLIDLYTYSSRASPDDDEPPIHLGYHYLLPNVLRKSDGKIEMPITCAIKHRPLGMMKVEYIRISPLNSSVQLNMRRSFIRYWNKRWKGLEVGHRGSGPSFKPSTDDDAIRENTIASLQRAIDAGADMVEFDVQLSKDLVPVIYHDLHVYVSLKKKTLDENDYLELPMNELTLEQLKHLKVYHRVEGKSRQPKFFDEHLDQHQPFPQLSDVFDALDESVGFNIEVKWNMELFDGRHEMDRVNKNPNLYLDCILDVVLAKAGNRRVVFSCFDPDICTMLRWKQNLYPVMFLSQGISDRYEMFHDPRGDTIENAVFHANSQELLGIVAHTIDLLRDTNQLNLATNLGLVCFCWGDENNSKDTIKFLKSLNIHGIIYDKMDKLTEKNVKRSIFYVEGKDSQKDILRLRQLEQTMQETSTASTTAAAAAAAESSSTSVEMQPASSISNETAVRMENGYPVEIPVIGESQ